MQYVIPDTSGQNTDVPVSSALLQSPRLPSHLWHLDPKQPEINARIRNRLVFMMQMNLF